jgi:hypothetical protein
MKVTLEIKDLARAEALLNFLKSLSFIDIKTPKSKANNLPDWHIAVLQNRLNEAKNSKGKAIDFDQAMEEIEKQL